MKSIFRFLSFCFVFATLACTYAPAYAFKPDDTPSVSPERDVLQEGHEDYGVAPERSFNVTDENVTLIAKVTSHAKMSNNGKDTTAGPNNDGHNGNCSTGLPVTA